jgi:transposase
LLGVERWAEIRRMRFVERLSIREIARRTGHDRKTVQRAVRSDTPPHYVRAPGGSKLDAFKDEIGRLLLIDPRMPGRRVRELLSELGYAGGKTILDDYLREVRPRYLPRPRTFQRTVYHPGEHLLGGGVPAEVRQRSMDQDALGGDPKAALPEGLLELLPSH